MKSDGNLSFGKTKVHGTFSVYVFDYLEILLSFPVLSTYEHYFCGDLHLRSLVAGKVKIWARLFIYNWPLRYAQNIRMNVFLLISFISAQYLQFLAYSTLILPGKQA